MRGEQTPIVRESCATFYTRLKKPAEKKFKLRKMKRIARQREKEKFKFRKKEKEKIGGMEGETGKRSEIGETVEKRDDSGGRVAWNGSRSTDTSGILGV